MVQQRRRLTCRVEVVQQRRRLTGEHYLHQCPHGSILRKPSQGAHLHPHSCVGACHSCGGGLPVAQSVAGCCQSPGGSSGHPWVRVMQGHLNQGLQEQHFSSIKFWLFYPHGPYVEIEVMHAGEGREGRAGEGGEGRGTVSHATAYKHLSVGAKRLTPTV